MRYRSGFIAAVLLMGCAAEDPLASGDAAGATEALTGDELAHVVHGGQLFVSEEFDGNGVVCADCHRPLNGFDLAPLELHVLRHLNPSHPLFNPLNSDDGDGASFDLFLEHALVPVHVVAAANVTVDEVDGTNVSINEAGRYVVRLFRAVPTSTNSALNEHLMWDGREADDLAHQALSAVFEHTAPGRVPTASELEDIALFQSQLFSSPDLRAYANGGDEPTLPEVPSVWTGAYGDSLRRGRTFFEDTPITSFDPEHRGLCAACHSGPMLNTTGHFNPGDPPGLRFAGNRTSEFNDHELPEYTFRVALPHDLVMPPGIPLPIPPGTVVAPAGTPLTIRTSDPGALIVDTDPNDGVDAANPCISPLPCLVSVVTGSPMVIFHRIPTLYGTATRAPFFHDHSASSLEEVVDHYREFFVPTELSLRATADALEAQGDLATATFLRSIADALLISDQDKSDIVAYMRFAFR